MNRHHIVKRVGAAFLAAVMAAAVTVSGAAPIDANASGYYEIKPSKDKRTSVKNAGTKAANAAQSGTILAAVSELQGTDASTFEATLEYLIESGDWTMISNYTGATLNINSMAGGIEPLSSYQVTFAASDSSALSAQGEAQVVIPLKQVMGGRTLRAGETVQGFLYNNADGVFYATATAIAGDQVVYNVPYFPANTDNRICFFVSRGAWGGSDQTYDYFAIGNSITLHPRRDFWPDAMGMGATSVSKDYFHIVERGLTRTHANVNAAAMNYSIWEILPENRTSTLSLLDPYLSNQLDLITIMLGENVILNRGEFATDYQELIAYIKAKAPNALVVLVGTFWQDDEIETIKMQTAAANGCLYVSLAALQNNTKYQFGNASAADANGVLHYSDNPGTSIHPNNAAMTYIGNQILAVLNAAGQ